MSLVSNNSKKVFLYLNRKINVNSKVDIILSPEFYWVRIFDIPVKNITQARHVLPTLFEDVLETVSELSYQVIKLEDGKYLCFAYSNKKIYEQIKNSGISLSLVNSIYFAQNECKEYVQFKVDDKSFLYTPDNILVKVPNAIATQAISLDDNINKIELSSNNVDIKLYNNVLNTKQIYSIVAVLLIISFVNFYKIFDYKNETLNLDEKIEKTKSISSLPSSMIQTNAILKSYETKVSKEIIKREALEYILKNRNFTLKKVDLRKDILSIDLLNTDKRKAEKYISKKYKVVSSSVNSLVLKIRIKL